MIMTGYKLTIEIDLPCDLDAAHKFADNMLQQIEYDIGGNHAREDVHYFLPRTFILDEGGYIVGSSE